MKIKTASANALDGLVGLEVILNGVPSEHLPEVLARWADFLGIVQTTVQAANYVEELENQGAPPKDHLAEEDLFRQWDEVVESVSGPRTLHPQQFEDLVVSIDGPGELDTRVAGASLEDLFPAPDPFDLPDPPTEEEAESDDAFEVRWATEPPYVPPTVYPTPSSGHTARLQARLRTERKPLDANPAAALVSDAYDPDSDSEGGA